MKSNIDIKSIIEWVKNPKNQIISKFIFLFTLGLLLLSMGKFLTVNDNKQNYYESTKLDNIPQKETVTDNLPYDTRLEKELAELLCQVKGVGNVDVMITLEDEILIEPAFNTINTEKTSEEKDNEGGVRTITEKQTNQQVVLLRRNGEEDAMVLKKTTPKIKGVLIISDGASAANIREKIIKSTATLLDIPIYKISVLAK
ncbi:MAG: stage III sporulation protein AG [Thermoanaerobacteraceae bacterium]|nr:stage III sporulation protein AG [Thermoanaerobacteraceae bacterium]